MSQVLYELIREVVLTRLSLSLAEFHGHGRSDDAILARSTVAYLARRMTGLSFPQIGRCMQRPSHAIAFEACRRCEAAKHNMQGIEWGGRFELAGITPGQDWAMTLELLEVEIRAKANNLALEAA